MSHRKTRVIVMGYRLHSVHGEKQTGTVVLGHGLREPEQQLGDSVSAATIYYNMLAARSCCSHELRYRSRALLPVSS